MKEETFVLELSELVKEHTHSRGPFGGPSVEAVIKVFYDAEEFSILRHSHDSEAEGFLLILIEGPELIGDHIDLESFGFGPGKEGETQSEKKECCFHGASCMPRRII